MSGPDQTAVASPERRWLPSSLHDEIIPPLRDTPEAWIIGANPDAAVGGYVLAGWEDDDTNIEGRQIVQVGETVGFSWYVGHGAVDVTISAGGAYEAHGPIPPEANCFWMGCDIDTLAPSMAEFASDYAEFVDFAGDADAFPARVAVDMYQWSDDTPHRLIVEDGKPRFVPLGQPEGWPQ